LYFVFSFEFVFVAGNRSYVAGFEMHFRLLNTALFSMRIYESVKWHYLIVIIHMEFAAAVELKKKATTTTPTQS